MQVDPAFYVVFLSLSVGLFLFSIIEIVVMQWTGIAERPKSIWYPILANFITFIGILIVVGLFAALIAMGLIVAMGSGFDSAEWMINGAYATPILIPLIAVIVRFVLFLMMKLGKAGKASVYAAVSTIASLTGVVASSTVIYVMASLLGVV